MPRATVVTGFEMFSRFFERPQRGRLLKGRNSSQPASSRCAAFGIARGSGSWPRMGGIRNGSSCCHAWV